MTCAELHVQGKEGLSLEKQQQLQHLFGPNFIKVPVKPVIWLIFHEVRINHSTLIFSNYIFGYYVQN